MKKYTATNTQAIKGGHIRKGQDFYATKAKGFGENYLLSWTKSRSGIFATIHKSQFEALTK